MYVLNASMTCRRSSACSLRYRRCASSAGSSSSSSSSETSSSEISIMSSSSEMTFFGRISDACALLRVTGFLALRCVISSSSP